jgi:hypothetical protein
MLLTNMLLAGFVTVHVVFSLQETLSLLYSGLDLDPTSVASKLGTGGIKTVLFEPGKDSSNTLGARRKLSENFSGRPMFAISRRLWLRHFHQVVTNRVNVTLLQSKPQRNGSRAIVLSVVRPSSRDVAASLMNAVRRQERLGRNQQSESKSHK